MTIRILDLDPLVVQPLHVHNLDWLRGFDIQLRELSKPPQNRLALLESIYHRGSWFLSSA